MSYRTRIPGTTGAEVDFESREALEGVTTSMPFAGPLTAVPVVVGKRRRRQEEASGGALAPQREPDTDSPHEAGVPETQSHD